MDDVLCDFYSFYAELIQPETPTFNQQQWAYWKNRITEYDFASLQPREWYWELRAFLRRNKLDYYIITSATLPAHIAGKRIWLETYMPEILDDRLIVTKAKHLCAAPNRLLLDDYMRNTNAWREAGGDAILVPAPHSSTSRHIHEFNPVEEIKRWLD